MYIPIYIFIIERFFIMADKRFAILIDAENISDKYIKVILDEVSNDGIITYKRIYGDWTKAAMSSWKNVLLSYSITPIQQYNYTTGKSSTDSAMIIDAMDILYSGNVDGFCIVSSDSDFTRLAVRLRESGMYVVGMGETKTPSPFVAACNRFKFLEIIGNVKKNISSNYQENNELNIKTVKNTVAEIIADISDENGWASLSEVGNILVKRFPSFDVRHFGQKKLTLFIESLNIFELKAMQKGNDPNVKVMYVKMKKR